MLDPKSLHLDKSNSALPLYEQLRRGLMAAITQGVLPVGSKMPTEEELCTALDISRPVVRQAYNALIDAGYVVRMRGKGTFVQTLDSRGRFLNNQLSFAEEMRILGLEHKTQVTKKEWLTGSAVPAKLRMGHGARCLHITRERYVSDKPYILVENYLPESIFPGIDQYDFGPRSLYEVFSTVYDVRVVRSYRTMAAQVAGQREADFFGIAVGSPVMYVENVVFDQYDRVIDLSVEHLDGRTMTFEFEVFNP